MRYFRCGDYAEFDELPEDAALLVRAIRTDNVNRIKNALDSNNTL